MNYDSRHHQRINLRKYRTIKLGQDLQVNTDVASEEHDAVEWMAKGIRRNKKSGEMWISYMKSFVAKLERRTWVSK